MSKPPTPVMRQYQAAKLAYPDAIVLFRLGDFYEMFYDDAVVASRALELTLTSRNKGAPDEIPMAGVPYHAAGSYIGRLLSLGHKVAICEQMADPSKTRGIVPRSVVRVLTPGLVTDGEQLDGRTNHYLCAIEREGGGGPLGVSVLDLSTAELSAARVESEAMLFGELSRLDPREILLSSGAKGCELAVRQVAPRAVVRADEPLAEGDIAAALSEVLDEAAVAEALRTLAPEGLAAAARVLRFARRCSPATPLPVRRIAAWDPSDALALDEVTQVHLELVRAMDGGREGTLLSVLEEPRTPFGTRLLRRWLLAPLRDVGAIRRRLDAVETFVQNPLPRGELREALARVGDLERLSVRAELGEATPRDLGALRDGLAAAPSIVDVVRRLPNLAADGLLSGAAEVDPVADLAELLSRALVARPPALARDGGILRAGYDAALDEARTLKEHGTEQIVALEARLRETSGIPTLKVRYTRVFGWYIEVTRAHVAKVPAAFRRKQTVAGGERFTCEELADLEDRIAHAEEQFESRETELVRDLVSAAARAADRTRCLATRLAEWDVYAALAETAHRRDYVRPEVDAGPSLDIEDGRHPVVEQLAAAGRFVPNDVHLDQAGERLWLITGPNMAGKSTLMRQVALIVVLAQMGCYVPAKRARVGVVDRILSRVGASDNLSRGESTFMVEMRETAHLLARATSRSLVIVDEIGRGTSTYDGLAIAWAVAEHLHDIVACRGLFATHYHELTRLAESLPSAANYSVSAKEHDGGIVFFHKLARGPASRSYGVAVARLAGLPEPVLARAKAVLTTLESEDTSALGGRPPGAREGAGQLDLFGGPVAPAGGTGRRGRARPEPRSERDRDALAAALRAVDLDRTTPLDALALLAKLKKSLDG